jgi:ACS family hexuronate transporter-like MFS transporter
MNYVDRQAVALLKPVLQDPVSGIGLTEVNYGYIVTAFSLAYALGLLVVGRFIDRAGTKIGYAVAVAVGPWAENWYPPPLANQEI